MKTESRRVTMKGKPFRLDGISRSVGAKAPDCLLVRNDLTPVRLSQYLGSTLLLASVPSLDTSVCDAEARRFNLEAASLGNTAVLVISMDLPFAQKRWCGAAGIERVETLSDHRGAEYGTAFGVLIPDLRLLARAIWVIDPEGVIRHQEIVPELTEHPDYASALAAAKGVAASVR